MQLLQLAQHSQRALRAWASLAWRGAENVTTPGRRGDQQPHSWPCRPAPIGTDGWKTDRACALNPVPSPELDAAARLNIELPRTLVHFPSQKSKPEPSCCGLNKSTLFRLHPSRAGLDSGSRDSYLPLGSCTLHFLPPRPDAYIPSPHSPPTPFPKNHTASARSKPLRCRLMP